MKLYLQECIGAGHEILLCGDFNEDLTQSQEGLARTVAELGLVNIMTHHHGKSLPATYLRGTRCLDHAYGTRRVAEATERAGYDSFQAKFHTDHRIFL